MTADGDNDEVALSHQVQLVLTSQPSRVRVYVEGEQVGRTPFDESINFPPDTENVEVMLRKTDHETRRFTVSRGAGTVERHIRMRRETTERQPEPEEGPTFDELPLNFGE